MHEPVPDGYINIDLELIKMNQKSHWIVQTYVSRHTNSSFWQLPSGQAIHIPQISAWNYGGISGDHPRGNFLIISLRKFRVNKGEFSMWIFPPPFPVESLGIFPRGNFPRASLKNFKMQFNDIGRVPVMWKYPSDDLMSFFGELKCLQVWGNFPLISTAI